MIGLSFEPNEKRAKDESGRSFEPKWMSVYRTVQKYKNDGREMSV